MSVLKIEKTLSGRLVSEGAIGFLLLGIPVVYPSRVS